MKSLTGKHRTISSETSAKLKLMQDFYEGLINFKYPRWNICRNEAYCTDKVWLIKRSISRTNKHWYCSPSKTRNGFTVGVKLPTKHFLLKEDNRPIPYKIHCTLSIRLKVVIRGHSPPRLFLWRMPLKKWQLEWFGLFLLNTKLLSTKCHKDAFAADAWRSFFQVLTPEDIFGDESERNGKWWSGNF